MCCLESIFIVEGFYWKLVTTGTENKDPDVIKTVLEEEEDVVADEPVDQAPLPRNDLKRHSKRIIKHNSLKTGETINTVLVSATNEILD